MLIARATLDRIADDTVTLAFRRWKRCAVRSGGTVRTAVGVLRLGAVESVEPARITEAEAIAAGYADATALRTELARREGGTYRIELGLDGPDPRIALRARPARGTELGELTAALARLDRASRSGAWTSRTLRAIRDRPGVRAGELAATEHRPLPAFKAGVRKLKDLGLTESLEVGYRLSPRGTAFLRSRAGSPVPGGSPQPGDA
ncbi:hypothetical protein CFN78_16830 [Amycolatopsis antarctica]|uniref:ASCH domain-containing protein n=1 Tax=Amycolatopsis antarctica TaxID=1854586 RepID=A0A263D1H0_9PSEU|nr:hypothetical protein [Amycolatopsis antarctica]OZM72191.1 hypothetical protein CFN78_16830 [Amycolatopsis antarctica]